MKENLPRNTASMLVLSIIIASAFLFIPVSAQTEGLNVGQDAQASLPPMDIPSIPPGHLLYSVKVGWEELLERLTFNKENLALLKQKHLQERVKELRYEAAYNYNRHSDDLVKRIQLKRLEIEQALEELRPRCVNIGTNEIVPCNWFSSNQTEAVYSYIKRQNQEVLTSLLNDPNMPNASRKGLQNAMERSGVRVETKNTRITANQIQPATFVVSETTTALLPFTSAMIYDPTQEKWYSIVVSADAITISEQTLTSPEYFIYPTQGQIQQIEAITRRVNQQGSLTAKDKIELTLLWWQIQKRGG